jgi:hypothetical protein
VSGVIKVRRVIKKERMDALRNTLLEWSLTASPCSNVGNAPDTWGPPRLSEDEGARSAHGGITWNSRRHPHHYNSGVSQRLHHSPSGGCSAALSASYRSILDTDEEFDERQHLREALRSATGFRAPLTVSSRASIDMFSSRSTSATSPPCEPSSLQPNGKEEGVQKQQQQQQQIGACGYDSDADMQLVSMLATRENDVVELGVCTPHHACHHLEDLDASLHLLPFSKAPFNASTGATDAEGCPLRETAAPDTSDTGDDRHERLAESGCTQGSPFQLSTALLQGRRSASGDSSSNNSNAAAKRSTRRSQKDTHLLRLPRPTSSVASSKSFGGHSVTSSGCRVDDDICDNASSSRVASQGQPLLRPSPFVEPDGSPHDDGSEAAHQLVSLRDVFVDDVKEEDVSMADVSVCVVNPRAESFTPPDGKNDLWGDTRAGERGGGRERLPSSSTQGLSVSMVIASAATNLSRTSPRKSLSGSNSVSTVESAGKDTAASVVAETVERRWTASTPESPITTAAHTNSKVPPHLSSPAASRARVSSLQCHVPLVLDDHVVAHIFPLSSETTTTTTTNASTEDKGGVVANTAGAASSDTAAAAAPRHPLLIPQPHRSTKDINGRSVLLRAHRHFSAVPSPTMLQANSNSHSQGPLHHGGTALDSSEHASDPLAGVGLSAVPQPFGAYPYQWMVVADHMRQGGPYSSESSYSTAFMRRASSSVAMSRTSSCGTASTATPAAVAGLPRSFSDGQLYAASSRGPPQVC